MPMPSRPLRHLALLGMPGQASGDLYARLTDDRHGIKETS